MAPYRVLDLTDERGLLAGKIFADLGADVIKIERPGGDPARSVGPFYKDVPDPQRSLFWFAYNTGKRSITLNIESSEGQELLKSLVKSADLLVESFPPGYMDKLGLGYQVLSELNHRLIMTSITPFGQTGPYASWKGPDIVPWAMGCYMWMTGEPGRAPLRISHPPQAYLHASAMAAVGSLMALRYRAMTGEGQHVDVSAQQCPVWMLTHTYAYWDLMKVNLGRQGGWRAAQGLQLLIAVTFLSSPIPMPKEKGGSKDEEKRGNDQNQDPCFGSSEYLCIPVGCQIRATTGGDSQRRR